MESPPDVIEECTNLQWSKISLSSLPQLEREVDHVAKLFLQVQLHGDGDMIEQVFNKISERVDELESFYWEHNRDPRIMLLEKQRLRLKKCLQGRRAPTPPAGLSFAQGRNSLSISAEEYASASSPNGLDFQRQNPQSHLQNNQDSHTTRADSFGVGGKPIRETRDEYSSRVEMSPSSRGSPRSPRRESEREAADADAQYERSRRVSAVTKQSTDTSLRKGVQPIYAWERKGSMLRQQQEQQQQQQMEQLQQQYGSSPGEFSNDMNSTEPLKRGSILNGPHAITNNRRSSDMSNGTTHSNGSSYSNGSSKSTRSHDEEEQSEDEVATFKVVVSEKDYHRIKARQWVVQSARRYRELHQAATNAAAEGSTPTGTGDETLFLSGDSAYVETKMEYRKEDPDHWLDSKGFRRLTRTDVTPRW